MVDISGFDYEADQLFVVAPINAGGGILSFLLSLDHKSAALDFKHKGFNEKIQDWDRFYQSKRKKHAHLYRFMHFGSPNHTAAMSLADRCARYVHTCHFYELDGMAENRRHPLLNQITGRKQSIGIFQTDSCVEKLYQIRPETPQVDHSQLWIYSNQKPILKDFFDIDCQHLLPFSDLLDVAVFIDHVKYCADLIDLDINIDACAHIIQQWYELAGIN